MSDYIIHEETLTAIADKIREKKYQTNRMTPAEMVEELDGMGLPFGMNQYPDYYRAEPWVRPDEYPNLELIDLTDFDGVYLTYDLRKTPDYGWIGIYEARALNQLIYIERGHLDENNNFVVDEQHSVSGTKKYFRQDLDPEDGNVQLWRVWTDGHFTELKFATNTDSSATSMQNALQPCVERRGRLPYITVANGAPDSRNTYSCFSTRWLIRDDIKDVTNLTNMSSAYEGCHELREVHFDGWDTSKVTNMSRTFTYCHKLRYIPFHKLVTPKVTTLSMLCHGCYSLDNVDISHFDIDKVTNMGNMLENCRSLTNCIFPENGGVGALTNIANILSMCSSLAKIPENFERLNVTNVTSMNYSFQGCHHLKTLDLSSWNVQSVTTMAYFALGCNRLEYACFNGWDVSHVTAANSIFDCCRSLQKLDIDDWSLDSVTTLHRAFYNCYCLKENDILSRIDFSTITTLSNVFTYCMSLRTVLIDNCDVDNVITTMSNMFGYCWSLRSIHMPNMHFTQPVAIDSMFVECTSLTDLNVSGWHIDALQAITGLFSSCYMLQEIDLSDWVIDDGYLTAKNTVASMFSGLRSCRVIKASIPITMTTGNMSYLMDNMCVEYLDIGDMDLTDSSNINITNPTNNSPLVEFFPPHLPPVSFSISYNVMLSRASLLRIIDRLPVVTTTKKLTLGQSNFVKLTPEEIAVGTAKGWNIVA